MAYTDKQKERSKVTTDYELIEVEDGHLTTKEHAETDIIYSSDGFSLFGEVEATKEDLLDSKTSILFSPMWKQSLAASVPILLNIALGLTSGFSATLLPQLEKEAGPIPADEETASWIAEGASDTEQARQEEDKSSTTLQKTNEKRQMSDSYMWKEQIHTLMKGGESESDISDSEHFLTKGAFLLTPSHGLSMEKASTICEKMEFKGCFSLTKTATGILFKFSSVDDYQMVFKKGFHKVTGSRFYRKIAIPCRPQKTFTIYVYDIPDEIPEEDVRHALYKFTSVVEVVRLYYSGSPKDGNTGTSTPKPEKTSSRALTTIDGELVSSMVPKEATSVVRVTLANIEEANILLQNGLDFYGATFFPTELATPTQAAKLIKPSKVTGGTVSARVRDLLPVFDQQGFAKFAPPASRLVKPRSK
ncbi:uncharacterized protein LOC119630797 isoform X3 [Bombyx mori]|uniref:uncharacterized protein LOC119630797 isoform X3 n=1 Tax=Bombyx mori TaxID=7091 RepID=UPI002ED2D39C